MCPSLTSQKNSFPLSVTNHEIHVLSSSDAESSLPHRTKHIQHNSASLHQLENMYHGLIDLNNSAAVSIVDLPGIRAQRTP